MFKGSAVALVTPMHTDTSIDFDALIDLVEWQVSSGTQALVINGTTAETPTLSWSEQCQIIEAVVQKVNGRIPIIVGTGSNATAQVIERNKIVSSMGVDGLLIVSPYYNKPTQQGLISHFESIAEHTDLPILLYNHPGRTGVDLEPEAVIHLSQQKNIVGIKEVSGDLHRIQAYKQKCHPDSNGAGFHVYCGDDAVNLPFILQGGDGVISVSANIVPTFMQQMCEYALLNDITNAQILDAKMQPLNDLLAVESNPIPVKWALHLMGKISTGIRLPLIELTEVHRAPLKQILKVFGE
tara:strand:+ start:58002 stop:58889 length:888 start_codon:yes stop_codon:yes gene_type:complete